MPSLPQASFFLDSLPSPILWKQHKSYYRFSLSLSNLFSKPLLSLLRGLVPVPEKVVVQLGGGAQGPQSGELASKAGAFSHLTDGTQGRDVKPPRTKHSLGIRPCTGAPLRSVPLLTFLASLQRNHPTPISQMTGQLGRDLGTDSAEEQEFSSASADAGWLLWRLAECFPVVFQFSHWK